MKNFRIFDGNETEEETTGKWSYEVGARVILVKAIEAIESITVRPGLTV